MRWFDNAPAALALAPCYKTQLTLHCSPGPNCCSQARRAVSHQASRPRSECPDSVSKGSVERHFCDKRQAPRVAQLAEPRRSVSRKIGLVQHDAHGEPEPRGNIGKTIEVMGSRHGRFGNRNDHVRARDRRNQRATNSRRPVDQQHGGVMLSSRVRAETANLRDELARQVLARSKLPERNRADDAFAHARLTSGRRLHHHRTTAANDGATSTSLASECVNDKRARDPPGDGVETAGRRAQATGDADVAIDHCPCATRKSRARHVLCAQCQREVRCLNIPIRHGDCESPRSDVGEHGSHSRLACAALAGRNHDAFHRATTSCGARARIALGSAARIWLTAGRVSMMSSPRA